MLPDQLMRLNPRLLNQVPGLRSYNCQRITVSPSHSQSVDSLYLILNQFIAVDIVFKTAST